MSEAKISFEYKRIILPLDAILPVRQSGGPQKRVVRYNTILASIKEVGVIEPLMVYPQGKSGRYLLMDGHLRYYALKELKISDVECLISTDDESFTYNARISRLSPIQEHTMIVKAVKNGVTPKRIAAALNLKIKAILSNMNLLDGIHDEAVDLLKDKQMSPATIRILKRVTAGRQIEMAELMVSSNTYTKGYVEALLMGTSRDQLVNPEKPKKLPGMTAEDIARLEQEMEVLERDFKAIEESYGENMLNLTLARGYVKKLLDNPKVVRFLTTRHTGIFNEFESVATAEGL